MAFFKHDFSMFFDEIKQVKVQFRKTINEIDALRTVEENI